MNDELAVEFALKLQSIFTVNNNKLLYMRAIAPINYIERKGRDHVKNDYFGMRMVNETIIPITLVNLILFDFISDLLSY